MARERNFGGGDTIGTHSDPEGTPSGSVTEFGPTITGALHRGEKQMNRGAGDAQPPGFGGAPTIENPKSQRSTRGGGANVGAGATTGQDV